MTEYEYKLRRPDRRVLAVLLTGAANLGQLTVIKLSGASPARAAVVLARLERCGIVLLAPGHLVPGETRLRRKFYRLTPDGRAWAMEALGLEEPQ